MNEAYQTILLQAPSMGGLVLAVWICREWIKALSKRLDRCEKKWQKLETKVNVG